MTILPSQELTALRLKALAWKRGKITEAGTGNNGFFVELDEAYLDHKEWFIPMASIQVTNG